MKKTNSSISRMLCVLGFLSWSTVACQQGPSKADSIDGAPRKTGDGTLIQQLSRGGHVIVFRHSSRNEAVGGQQIIDLDKAAACADGSTLTEKGEQEAIIIGQKIRALGLSVERILYSPTCRTLQMGALFGLRTEMHAMRFLLYPSIWTPEESQSIPNQLKVALSTPPQDGYNVIFLGHKDTMRSKEIGADPNLGQGDAAVFKPTANGQFEYLGVIPKSEWLR